MTAIWQPAFKFMIPPELQPLIDDLNEFHATANEAADLAKEYAELAKLALMAQAAPVATAALLAAQKARKIVEDFFGGGGYMLPIDPLQEGVGIDPPKNLEFGVPNLFKRLSFPDTVRLIEKKLIDSGDPRRPKFSEFTEVEALCVVIGSPSPAIFLRVIRDLNELLGIKELAAFLKHLEIAFELDSARMDTNKGPRMPLWQAWMLRDIPPMAELENALLEQISMLEGYAKAALGAIMRTIRLIERKQAQLERLQLALNLAMAMLNGGMENAGVYSCYATGMGTTELAKQIRSSIGYPGQELSLCGGVVLVAPKIPGQPGAIENLMKFMESQTT